ncbi:MarR family winged helix-turn-helix transcriptional regulator [Nonomuraea lactucae]|uniref:MarR family winged helix-turn-helix transcriptional regulator n=1 Tax=Nonomuraea lactucae TaxID=2249762 RepID=UPI000DE42F90|nr:MarR family transcriptional regulator [Nonomuraea lactucae]
MKGLILHDQLCFAVHTASRALDALYRRELAELGLTYPQYLVMLVLWERERASVKELGAALRLDSGTLSPLLKRLEAAGLVRRERDPGDERSVLVRPTAEGARLRERAEPVPLRLVAATGLSREDLGDLRRILDRLTGSLSEAVS